MSNAKTNHPEHSFWSAIEVVLPGIKSLRNYQSDWLRYDLVAGMTVFALLVPSALAYAELAGVAPVAGLYTALAAMIAYALLASSPQLMVGPESTVAILTASTIAPLVAKGDSASYAALSALLALIVGILLIIGGLARLGFLVDFLSKPILLGYFNGATLVVLVSQLGKIFGFKLQSSNFFPQIWEVLTKLNQINWLTFLVGASVTIGLLLLRQFVPKAPGALIAVVLMTAISALFHLQELGVAVVGQIPTGLPVPKLPFEHLNDAVALLPGAAGMAVLIFADGVLTGRIFATKNRYALNANQELIALGGANVGASLFQGIPCAVSQSRSSVNDSMAGKTQVVGLVAALMVLLFLLFLSPLLGPLPIAVLAACIIVASLGMIDFVSVMKIFKERPVEGLLALATTLGVLTIGILPGIIVAGVLALANVIAMMARPHNAVLGHEAGIDGYHELYASDDAEALPGLVVYRFDAPLFYANATYFHDQIRDIVDNAVPHVRWLLINAEPMSDIDVTAAEMFKQLHRELSRRNIRIAIARASYPLHQAFQRMELTEIIGSENFFPTVTEGAEAFEHWQSEQAK